MNEKKTISLLKRLVNLDNEQHIFIDEPAAYVEMQDILQTAQRLIKAAPLPTKKVFYEN